MDKKLISVIVPIYDVEKYLKICIDSILKQTYGNIEIILIDDGSPDGCPKICDEYKKKDARVIVIHKENGGLSDARNTGLRIAKGEYVTFVDSDDYLNLNFLSIMYNKIEELGSDIAFCDYMSVDESSLKQFSYTQGNSVTMSNVECLTNVYRPRKHGMSFVAWGKIYKKRLFDEHTIEFPVGKIHEDTYTTYKLLYHSSKITFISNELYYYRKRSGSIMDKGFSLKSLDKLEAVSEASLFFWRREERELLTHALNSELLTCIDLYKKAKYENVEIRKIIKKQYLNDMKKYLKKTKMPFGKKLYYRIIPVVVMR